MDAQQLSGIVSEVLKRLNMAEGSYAVKKKVLVVLDDCKDVISALDEVKDHICGYDACLLTGNANSTHAFEGFERIFTIGELALDVNEWIRQFEKVLIPCPSLKMLSKIAHVFLDDRYMEVVFSALQENRQVMTGRLPESKIQNLTPALKSEIQKLELKLKDFGIGQITAINRQSSNKPGINAAPPASKKVLSVQDVISMAKDSGEICINAKTVITPLALDYIKDKRISVKRKQD